MQTKKLIQVGIVTSIFVAAVVSFYASSNPDGLEYVAEQVGFLNTAKDSAVAGSPFADYSIIGINNERISVAIAGVLGVGLTALFSFGLFSFIKRK
jgi:cobalt/nickel transport protein